MWKKCLAFSGVLGLIILLDPTPTPAQPGGFGGKGGGRDRGGFGAPPGGGTTFVVQPGGGPAVVTQPGGFGAPPSGGFGAPPGGGFGGGRDRGSFGAPPGGDTGGFGGGRDRGGFGAPPGGGNSGQPGGGFGPPSGGPGGGGPRGGMDPERGWMMLQRLTNSTGETVDLGAIPPQTRDWLKGMTERTGGIPLPESGVWTKAQYLDHFTRSEAARAATSASSGNNGPGGDRMSRGPGGPGSWGGGGFDPNNGGGWGGGWGDMQRPAEKKEAEEERPVAMRYGKLPKDLPSWFEDYDTDKDGQVGLYEWRKAGKPMADFTAMDLNGDGFVTADEYLRFSRQENINTKIAAYEETGVKPGSGWGLGTAGPSAGGDTKGKGGPGGWGGPKGGDSGGPGKGDGGKGDRPDRGDKGEKGKGNPWMRKN